MANRVLASYLPELVVHQLVDGSAEALHTLQGATLQADLSGFTGYTARLTQDGAAGAEKLTADLDRMLGLLVDQIRVSGGDVFEFAGDGVLALWPTTEDLPLADAVARALGCAWRVQRAIQADQADTHRPLGLSVGLGAGPVRLIDLETGPGRRQWVLTGAAQEQAARAERAARSGTTVVSPEAVALSRVPVLGTQLPRGAVRVDQRPGTEGPPTPAVRRLDDPVLSPEERSSDALPARLEPYLPEAVLRRYAVDQGKWLAELRTVTTLFVRMQGVDIAGEDAARTLVAAAGALVHSQGGVVDQVLFEDAETCLLVAFGLPHDDHGDDAVRAVGAALELHALATERGHETTVAVATGRVFCGVFGTPHRRDYTLIGDPVNVAARLMRRMGSGVWCDATTEHAAAGRFRCVWEGSVELRGRKAAVEVSRVLGMRSTAERLASLSGLGVQEHSGLHPTIGPRDEGAHRSSATNPLLGHLAQRNALRGCLQAAATGDGVLAIVQGDLGMGKSLLLAHVGEEAPELGLRQAFGGGQPQWRYEPLRAWRSALEGLLGLDPARPREARRERLVELVGDDARLRAWLPLLGPLFDLELAETELTAAMSGPQRADATFDLLLHTVGRTCASDPAVVFLDDLHWLDEASCTLARLLGTVPSLCVVVATRPLREDPSDAKLALLGAEAAVTIRLDGLSDRALLTLACERIGATSLEHALERLLLQLAGGSPYFCEELVHALKVAGALVVAAGEARLRTDTELELPSSIAGLITGRLDRLPEDELLTVKVAAVLGRSFSVDALRAAHPLTPDEADLAAQLQHLAAVGLVVVQDGGGESRASFRHDLVQRAAYELLGLPERRRIHRLAAEHFQGQARTPPAATAHHWLGADEPVRALAALERAGRSALQAGQDGTALGSLEAAASIARTQPRDIVSDQREGELLGDLGSALHLTGHIDRAEDVLRRSLTLLGIALPRSAPGWVLRLLLDGARQSANRILPPVLRPTAPPAQRATLVIASRTAGWYANLSYYRVDPLPWLAAGLLAANTAERAGEPSVAGTAYVNLANIMGTLHLRALERRYLHLAAASPEPRVELMATWSRAVVDLAHCDWASAQAALERGLDRGLEVNDSWALGRGLTIKGIMLSLTGRLRECVPVFDEVLAVTRQRDNVQHEGYGVVFATPALLALGRAEEARERLDAGRARLDRFDYFSRVAWHGCRAGVLHRLGRLEEGVSHAVRALELFDERPLLVFTYRCALSLVAEVLVDATAGGQTVGSRSPAQLVASRDRALKLLRQGALPFRYFRPRRHMLEGTVAWQLGKERKARHAWNKALAVASRWQLPWDQGRVHAELARLLPRGTQERAHHRDAARALLEPLGAEGELQLMG